MRGLSQYFLGSFIEPYPRRSSLQTKNLFRKEVFLMNHLMMSWLDPFSFVKLQTLKQILQPDPISLHYSKQMSALQCHFNALSLFASEGLEFLPSDPLDVARPRHVYG